MSTTKFYLKPAAKNGLSLIMFVYQDKGRKFKMSTKIQTDKNNWTGKRIRGKSIEIIDKNKKLGEFEDTINEIEKEALQNNKYYTIDLVEKKFKASTQDNQQPSSFFYLLDQFMEESKITKTKSTVKGYGSTKTRLKEFALKKHYDICFENINQQFYEKFIAFLIHDIGLLNNSVGTHIKHLKVFLNYIKRNELISHQINTAGFKIFKEDVDIIALTEDELFRMYNLKDLSRHLEYVKDYFCLECFTGLRFSDISRIQHENIKGDFLEFRTQKTRDSLIVPLNVFAKEIIEKYKGKFEGHPLPPPLTNQKTNFYLKEIAETAGVTDFLILEKFSGATRITTRKQKCDLVTTHTGRKTFITLSYEKGMQTEMIMKISGIRSWNTLKKYLKVSEKTKLIKMNEFWNREKMNAI